MRAPLFPSHEPKPAGAVSARSVNWRGQSGRYYALSQEQLEDFVLEGHDLYVIAEGDKARWSGTAEDIIDDQASRARFRAAVKVASSILRMSAPDDGVERMKTQWDIEGGQLAGALALVT